MSNENKQPLTPQEQNPQGQAPQDPQTTAPAALTDSQRFTNMVIAEYATNATQGLLELNDAQRRIIQGYFIVIDHTLKEAEAERLRKNKNNSDHSYDNPIPYDWKKVNLTDLALDAVHYARMGMDMQEKNHLFPIPYANKNGGFYNITFTLGYSGIQYIAEKYALCKPKSVTIEVVYSNDVFKPIKKCIKVPVESYEFEIVNPFDRGDIIGGFGYIEYEEPSKNTLVIMSKAAMDKRKPKYASANFWGGKTFVWENGKKVETELDGWQDEMYRKTLVREVYSSKYIPRDPSKVDDNYQYMREREVVYAQMEAEHDALENGNKTPIDLPFSEPPAQLPENTQSGAAQTTNNGAPADPDF